MVIQSLVSTAIIYNLAFDQTWQYSFGLAILTLLGLAYFIIKRHYYKSLKNAL